MLKFFFITMLLYLGNLAYAQENTKEVLLGLGYGNIIDGHGDIPGHTFYILGQFSTGKKWLSCTGRLQGTYIERTLYYGPHQTFEKSNGANLDVELNVHLDFWRISLYPSIGPSIRYSSDQHINTSSIYYQGGQVIDFDVEYESGNHLRLGYTVGANLDFSITKRIILGVRLAGISYLNGSEYRYMTISLKNRSWNF